MKEFLDYLLYIGIISKENIDNLLSMIEEKSKPNQDKMESINKNDLIQSILSDYLQSLNKEKLSNLAKNIYIKYIYNKKLIFSKHLIKIIKVKEDQELKILKIFLEKWKIHLFNNKTKNKNKHLIASYSMKIPRRQKRCNTTDTNRNNLVNKNKITNFNKRILLYNEKKENNNIKNMILKEEEFNMNCTFSPNLILTFKKNKELKEKIKTKSLNTEKILQKKPKKTLDKERINRLYTDYRKQYTKRESLKRNLDIENGITFSPSINYESQYYKNIKDDLFKRNKKMLKDKKEFVDVFNYLRNLQMKGVNIKQAVTTK